MNTEFERPFPEATPTTAPYWEGLAQRKIRIQYSPSLERYIFYPRVISPGTLKDDLVWREIGGLGKVYTFTVAERPTAPHFVDAVPQFLAIVEWDEGPRVTTELVNVDREALRIGMRVKPVFVDYPEHEITMLRYEPAE